MPEMPEVEIIVRGLNPFVEGRTITAIDIIQPTLIKYPDENTFIESLVNHRIIVASRRGKYIRLDLDNDSKVIIHLRMTGKLLCTPAGGEIDKHACIIFQLDNGTSLIYADIRRLGTVELLTASELTNKDCGFCKGYFTLGPEPLSQEFTPEYLRRITQKNRGKIKPLLLKQNYLAGLGNIYVDEALAIAKIHPERMALTITNAEISALYKAINKVISDGIADGGTTFRDYRNSSGERGHHQEHLYVYNRKGEPCKFCHTPIERIVVGGRGTHYCPQCQQLPIDE